jgi:hypothetical protein
MLCHVLLRSDAFEVREVIIFSVPVEVVDTESAWDPSVRIFPYDSVQESLVSIVLPKPPIYLPVVSD